MGFYIEMISVGEGDSFLLTLDHPNGGEAHVLIDGGSGDRVDTIINHLIKYTNSYISHVIGTHLDNDHIAGLIEIINNIKVKTLVLNTPGNFDRWLSIRDHLKSLAKVVSIAKLEKGIEAANDLLKKAREKGIEVRHMYQGESLSCGNIILRVLNPTVERLTNAWAEKILEEMEILYKSPFRQFLVEQKTEAPPTTESNNASIIIELEYNEKPYALFTGDAGADVIKEVTEKKSYPFLKVPHHGSKTGLDDELIKQISPLNVYIPVGENPHGHPDLDILDLLRKQGAKTYCSEKTKNCRRECNPKIYNVICLPIDKPLRDGFEIIDPLKCINNKK